MLATSNRNLSVEVAEGRFREDLYYRLNVFPIRVPSLQERIEDLELLIWAFVKEYGERMGKRIESIPQKSIDALKRCPWRGNVRELRNVIERAAIVSKGQKLILELGASDNGPVRAQNPGQVRTEAEMQRMMRDNVIGLLDFGMVGRIEERLRTEQEGLEDRLRHSFCRAGPADGTGGTPGRDRRLQRPG